MTSYRTMDNKTLSGLLTVLAFLYNGRLDADTCRRSTARPGDQGCMAVRRGIQLISDDRVPRGRKSCSPKGSSLTRYMH